MTDKEALQKIKDWQNGYTSFTSRLLDLVSTADISNRMRLKQGFPEVVFAYERWMTAKDPDALFTKELG